jgi:hypothetical protein
MLKPLNLIGGNRDSNSSDHRQLLATSDSA